MAKEVDGTNPNVLGSGNPLSTGTFVSVNGLYSSKSTTHTDHAINVTGGTVRLTNYSILDGSPSAAPLYANGGTLDVGQGDLNLVTFTAPAAQVDSGTLRLHDMALHPYPGEHTAPLIFQTGGTLVVHDSVIDRLTNVSLGSGIGITSDNVSNRVESGAGVLTKAITSANFGSTNVVTLNIGGELTPQ